MRNYLNLATSILNHGKRRDDRTGTGTLSLFGERLEFDLIEGFPLVTTKKVFFKGVVGELLWMLSGSTNVKPLQEAGVHIWDEWADKDGELGPVYGYQWRNYNGQGVDQIKKVIQQIKTDPTSRRLLVVTANPAQEDKMALPPCPSMFQLYVDGVELSMHVYQRSCDVFLGGPFDIASYALLLSMIAKVTGKYPGKLIFSYGDAHLYLNHVDQAIEQVKRTPRTKPTLELADKTDIFDFTAEDIKLIGYEPHPPIKAAISV